MGRPGVNDRHPPAGHPAGPLLNAGIPGQPKKQGFSQLLGARVMPTLSLREYVYFGFLKAFNFSNTPLVLWKGSMPVQYCILPRSHADPGGADT